MNRQKNFSRLQWTTEEENLLKKLRNEQKMSSWKLISQIINKNFLNKFRTGKQCRERYINYVRFNNHENNAWEYEQDFLLFQKYLQEGAKWVKIAHFLPQKSENSIKNRFYGIIRKTIRKLQRVQKQNNMKVKKNLKPQYFTKILQLNSEQCNIVDQKQPNKLKLLQKQVIQFMLDCNEDKDIKAAVCVQQLPKKIQQFYDSLKHSNKNKKYVSQTAIETSRCSQNQNCEYKDEICVPNIQKQKGRKQQNNVQSPMKIISNIIISQPIQKQQEGQYREVYVPLFIIPPQYLTNYSSFSNF